MYRALVFLALAGCGYKLGPPDVLYGQAEPMILVQPSTDGRRWYIPVESETLGPQIFFVDTGYGYTACDDDLVEGLGLKTKGKVRVRGELGALKATKTRLPDLRIGGHTLSNITCQVRDIGETSSIRDPREVPVAGVIGMDVLRKFRVVFDPAAGQMHLLKPKSAERIDRYAANVVRLRREWFGLRTKVPLTIGDKNTWPLLDTGSTTTWIDGKRLGLDVSRLQEGVAFRGTGKIKSCCETFDPDRPALRVDVPDWAASMRVKKYLGRRFPDLPKSTIRRGLRDGLVADSDGTALRRGTRVEGSEVLQLRLPGIAAKPSPPTDVRTMYYYDLDTVAIGSQATGNTTLTDRQKGPFEPGLLGLNVLRLYKQDLDFRRGLARFTRVEPVDISTWARWHREGQGVGGGILLDGGSAAVSEATLDAPPSELPQ